MAVALMVLSVMTAVAQDVENPVGKISVIPRIGVVLSNWSNNKIYFTTEENADYMKSKYQAGFMGGTIEAESALGKGTRFTVILEHRISESIYYSMLFAGLDGTVTEKQATEKVIAVVGEGERESVFCEGFEILDGTLYYIFFIEKHDQTPAYYRVNVTTGEVKLKTAPGVLI